MKRSFLLRKPTEERGWYKSTGKLPKAQQGYQLERVIDYFRSTARINSRNQTQKAKQHLTHHLHHHLTSSQLISTHPTKTANIYRGRKIRHEKWGNTPKSSQQGTNGERHRNQLQAVPTPRLGLSWAAKAISYTDLHVSIVHTDTGHKSCLEVTWVFQCRRH